MQSWRMILLPFSWLYGLVTIVRNWLFDNRMLASYTIPNPSIVIGNITVGGTGKSPMTAYLAELLSDRQPAILSRGYGRKTTGPRLAIFQDTAETIGDEPLMYYRRFKGQVPVVVAEERKRGVELLNEQFPGCTILLDDAYQHRKVKAGFQLLLMTCDRPVFDDYPFPAGNLRETHHGLKRADAVVITKCPDDLTDAKKHHFIRKLNVPADRIFFSTIRYGELVPLFDAHWTAPEVVLLVTGIANPDPLKAHLEKQYEVVSMRFPDHHAFTAADIQAIQQKVATFASRRFALVTTEKDAVRLQDMTGINGLQAMPWFVQRMELEIDREEAFKQLVRTYVITADTGSR